MKKEIIAIDVETHLFGPCEMAPKIVCLSYCDEIGSEVFKGGAHSFLKNILERAVKEEVLIVGHYVAFDMACALRSFPDLWNLIFEAYEVGSILCTAIRERLLDISVGEFQSHNEEDGRKKHSYSLENIAKRKLDVELDKGDDTWKLRYADLENVPIGKWPQEAIAYSKQDSEICFQLFNLQEKRARSRSGRISEYTLPTQYDDTRADFALKLMSTWGIETDGARVEELWSNSIEKMKGFAETLLELGLARGQIESKQETLFENSEREEPPQIVKTMKAIRSAVEEHFPGSITPITPKGNVRTDKETLLACKWKPFVELVAFNSLQKLASTYISKLFEPVIHADFFAVGAASDRTSCSRPNLQNQIKTPGLRECFVPRPGRIFLACDFDSQEMRTLAQSCLDICGESKLADRYKKDRHFDPHLDFARRLDPKDPKRLRQQSKVANFGFPGGMYPQTFVDYARGWGLDLSIKEATNIRKAWIEQWPEMKTYFKHVDTLVGEADFGFQTIPQSGFLRGGVAFRDASNGYFQTLAAHASKCALWAVVKKCYADRDSFLYGSRPVLFIHDEIILETPEEIGHEAAEEIEQVMREAMEIWTPDVPAEASSTLMDCWSKKAERVIENDRLVVWRYEKNDNNENTNQ